MSNLAAGFHVAVTALSFQRVVCYSTRRAVKASAERCVEPLVGLASAHALLCIFAFFIHYKGDI